MAYKRISPAPVIEGGTGAQTLTSNGVLVGSGTSAISALTVGTNGQTLVGATGGAPAFATLTSTAGSLTFTTGANSLNIDVTGYTTGGTWTPVLNFGGATTGITYSTQTGSWARVGPLLLFAMDITLTSKGSATGSATITGLPVTSTADARVICVAGSLTYTGETSGLVSGTTISLEISNTGTALTAMNDTNFANNTALRLSGVYRV